MELSYGPFLVSAAVSLQLMVLVRHRRQLLALNKQLRSVKAESAAWERLEDEQREISAAWMATAKGWRRAYVDELKTTNPAAADVVMSAIATSEANAALKRVAIDTQYEHGGS